MRPCAVCGGRAEAVIAKERRESVGRSDHAGDVWELLEYVPLCREHADQVFAQSVGFLGSVRP